MVLAVAIGDVVVVCTGLLSMQTPWQLCVEEIFSTVYLSITNACTTFFFNKNIFYKIIEAEI